MSSDVWYANGLRFQCVRCGNCCSGSPGHVRVTDSEISAIASHLGMNEADFRRQHTVEKTGQGTCLTERSNDDCVFYNRGHGCVVYERRPQQCRTWPFWESVLASPDIWRDMAEDCPGIDSGRWHDVTKITSCVSKDQSATGPPGGQGNRI